MSSALPLCAAPAAAGLASAGATCASARDEDKNKKPGGDKMCHSGLMKEDVWRHH